MNAIWTKYLPGIIKEWLEGRPHLQKVIGNTGWLLFDRIMRIVIGLTIGAWVARYLGPSQFGELAYVLSFIAFFQIIADLQADGFIVRDIAQERGEDSVILGTAIFLRSILAIVAWVCASGLMFLLHPEDQQLFWLTVIIGGSMVFRAFDTVDLWFQSQSQSKRTVFTKFIAYFFSNGIKVLLLLNKAPLAAFAGVICLEGAATALGLIIAYQRFPTRDRWKVSFRQVKSLLYLCWPFMISSFMITVFMRIDQIMLKEMLGEKALGIYAAAIPISQAWSVIPSMLATSLAPFVARKMTHDENKYEDDIVNIFRFFAIFALSAAIMTSFASPWIIKILYGPQYELSAVILSVHVFVNIFIYQGIAQELWIVNKTVRSVALASSIIPAIIGIVLNLKLIRILGPLGAVFSTILTAGVSVTLIPCLLRRDLFNLYKRAFLGIGNTKG
jgi:O-antigen/teichoic acid export membrane protein